MKGQDKLNNAVLITGIHRSGSTWIGNMLALSPELIYIHEPFQVGIKYHNPNGIFDHWFEYVENNIPEDRKNEILDYIVALTSITAHDLKDLRTRQLHKIKRTLNNALKKTTFSYYKRRVLIKDPIAVFSSVWLYRNIDNLKVVVLIRRPEAFVSSLKKLNWEFDFNEFAGQPGLMNILNSEEKELVLRYAAQKPDIIHQGIALWNIIYRMLFEMKQKYPQWLFVKYEDIIQSPESEFKSIFKFCNVTLDNSILNKILTYSSSEKGNGMKKVSAKQADIWEKRISEDEYNLIISNTKSVSQLWY